MKYTEIYKQLKKAILRREFAPNQLVPSEKALTIKYGVSRITAKRALNELKNDGLIYRIQGKGSFVKNHGTLKSRQILLVLPFSSNSDLGNYVSGIQQVLKDTTWNLLSMTNVEFLHLSIEQLKKHYAGIIYYPQHIAKELPHLLKIYLHELPIVLLDQTISYSIIPGVISDNVGGGYLACRHLIQAGYHRIAFYTSTDFDEDFNGSPSERFLGYIKALRQSNLVSYDPFLFLHDIRSKDGGQLVSALKKDKIDAVIAENDVTAFHLLNVFQQNKIKIPQEMGLIGFDNLPLTKLTDPQLSSISQDFVQLGKQAMNLLLRQINDPKLIFDKQITVPVQLIKRQSTNLKGEK